ncbi:MAG: CoA-binding protein [Candidatus Krumholzibacteriota bacterium]|nr:CoA-binding protein [Candidatus Krumholzibacteriota bacterium]
MNFRTMFEPKTMAVIGLSLQNERHPANIIYNKNFFRYPVKVYPVNPRGGIYHKEKVFTSVSEIPEMVDLAIIAVRSEYVPGILEECINSGVGGAAVISGGFAESGNAALQERMVKTAKEAYFPFIGPNCLGIYSSNQVDTFFLPSERMVRPEAGKVSIVSQSGGILVDQMVKFAQQGVGLSRAISIGNKAVVRELELLRFLARDKKTAVIAFYVEGFNKSEGREFALAAGRCPKPVIVMKAGKSPGGSRAVTSHTASIAGDYAVFSSVMSQFGIVEARDEFEMVSFCESLSCYPVGIEGRVGIITASGGHGAVAVDTCAGAGLQVPPVPAAVQNQIRKKLSDNIQPIASIGNPIDLTGSAKDNDFVVVASELSKWKEIDCLLVLLLPYIPEITSDVGARLSQVSQESEKPIVAYVPHVEKYRMIIEGFQLNNVPVSHSIEGAVLMVEAMRRCRPC